SGDGSLRAAIATAQSGDQIVFDTSLKGQRITLTSGPLAITQSFDIEGPGADQLAISGNHASRIFAVSGGGTVTIAGLTITQGMFVGNDGGGAIVNAGSSLTLANDVLSNNEALSDAGGNAQGGAIVNVSGASLTVGNCLFTQNQALGNSGGSQANGGAIVNSASRLMVSHSTFSGNQARGGDGGGNGNGGAIVNTQSATATVSDSTFTGNQATGGHGGVVGANIEIGTVKGGAISNDASLTVL